MNTIISLTELAKRLGKNKSQISRWKKQGKVVMIGKKVDYESTINLLNLAKDMRGGSRKNKDINKIKGVNNVNKKTEQSVNKNIKSVHTFDSNVNSQVSFHKARAFKENILAQKAALELKVQKAEYVSKKDEQKKGFELAMKLKDKLLSIPDRVAPILAENNNQANIRKILKDEIHESIMQFINNGGFSNE